MNNILLWIVAIVGGVTGLLTTLYLTINAQTLCLTAPLSET